MNFEEFQDHGDYLSHAQLDSIFEQFAHPTNGELTGWARVTMADLLGFIKLQEQVMHQLEETITGLLTNGTSSSDLKKHLKELSNRIRYQRSEMATLNEAQRRLRTGEHRDLTRLIDQLRTTQKLAAENRKLAEKGASAWSELRWAELERFEQKVRNEAYDWHYS